MADPLAKFASLQIIEENFGVWFMRLAGFAKTHFLFFFEAFSNLWQRSTEQPISTYSMNIFDS